MTKMSYEKNKLNIVLTNTTFAKNEIKKMTDKEYVIIDSETSVKSLEVKYLLSDEVIKKFLLSDIEECPFETLSTGEKMLVKALYYVENNDAIVLNNILLYIDSYKRDIMFKYLKKINKTIIVITLDQEELIYADKIIIYNNNEFIYKDINELIDLEKTFKELDSELPFMIQLSLKLKYYKLVEKPILSMTRMVNKLWK